MNKVMPRGNLARALEIKDFGNGQLIKSERASKRRSLLSRVSVALEEPAAFTSSCALSGQTRTPCLGS